MPSDVNNTDGSSPEEQRKESDSQTDMEVSQLDGKLQEMGDKPEVQSIVDRLMNLGGDDSTDELENTNTDEEVKDAESDADKSDDADPPADGDEADADEGEDTPKQKKTAKAPAANDEDDAEEADDTESDEDSSDDKAVADPDAKEMRGYSNDANKRIRQLIAARNKAEAERDAALAEQEPLKEKASYRDKLEQTLATHKVDTKAWDEWTSLGLLMQQDPGRAAVILGRMAKAIGYEDPDGPIKKLDDDLTAMVTEREMTQEAAEKLQRQRLQTRIPQTTRREPSPDPRDSTSKTQSPSLPRLTRDDRAIGEAAIQAVNVEFAKKYPDQWAKLVPEIQAEMAAYQGTPPSLWGKIARDCAEKVVAKRKAKASVSSRPDQSLRATGGSSSRTATRNNTGPAKSKSDLADRIASGNFGRR